MRNDRLRAWRVALVLVLAGCGAGDDAKREPTSGTGVLGGVGGAMAGTTAGVGVAGSAGITAVGGAGGVGVAGTTGVGVAGNTGLTGGTGSTGGSGGVLGTGGTSGVAGTSGASGTGATGGTGVTGGTGMTGGTGGMGMTGGVGMTGGTAVTGGVGMTGGSMATGGTGMTGGAGGTGSGPLPKFVGNITSLGQVRSDFIQYWDQITPENEGKWGSVEGVRDQMNWGGLDAVYNYAKDHGIPFKEHTLVWGSQQPGWIGGLSQSEQRAEVEEWIRLFCERYPDTELIDVVNEPPPHTTPPYAQALGGAGASGWDWIVQAFQWADQYCPDSILILNDYNTIEWPNDHSHFIDIVKAIQAAGAPIDAIGAQAHGAYDRPTSTVQQYLDELASETGLPIYISEYDIDLADDQQQQQVMQEQFTMFWNDDDIAGITLWGYIEGQTWRPDTGLMSSGGQMRPAMTWLMDYLGR